ncbi:MAG: hypothetical protein R3335_02305 [Anaerolineales bacterium]|nr:hypothetical protein [Anaerolineales bacterium]
MTKLHLIFPHLMLLVLIGFLAACSAPSASVDDPSPPQNQPATGPGLSTAVTERPGPEASQTPPKPVGQLSFPYEAGDAGNVTILAGNLLEISWIGGPAQAERYDFFLIDADSGEEVLLGADLDASDGISIEWPVPEYQSGALMAVARFSDGSEVQSPVSPTVFSGQQLPEELCTVRSTSAGVVEVYHEPSLESESFAHIHPGTFQHVLAVAAGGWYQIDAEGAYDLRSGEAAGGTGWVSDHSTIGLAGPCEDLPIVD